MRQRGRKKVAFGWLIIRPHICSNWNNQNLNISYDFLTTSRRSFHFQHVVKPYLYSPNQLLPVIADNSWKKDCFKGTSKHMKILTSTFPKVPRIWSQTIIRTYLRYSPSLAMKEPRNGMTSLWQKCWESFQILKIWIRKTNDANQLQYLILFFI